MELNPFQQGRYAIDTSLFIYFIEENLKYLNLVNEIFEKIDKGEIVAVTSTLSILETIIVPLRKKNLQLVSSYELLLSQSKNLHLIEISRDVLILAAKLRAKYFIKTPDAIQIASGVIGNCDYFITNDKDLKKVNILKILVLEEYL